MEYRTKTYIAGDWTGDKDAIEQLYKWNESNKWSLSFNNAHDITQARDDSLNCSIKASLKRRLDVSKTFVLIVGKNTLNLRSGSCSYCHSYNSWTHHCAKGRTIDRRSYIDYECEMAVEAGMKIIVLYNSLFKDLSKCPEVLRYKGIHIAMKNYYGWNYEQIKQALC